MIGTAAGLVINIGGTTLYHLGDTCLFSDLKLIAERTPVDVALIPIGGHYTMDRHDAAVAAELIGAATVIPIHYDTFPPIETDAEAFKSEVESKTTSKVVVLQPGETHQRLSLTPAAGPPPEPEGAVAPVVRHQRAAGEQRQVSAAVACGRRVPSRGEPGVVREADPGGPWCSRCPPTQMPPALGVNPRIAGPECPWLHRSQADRSGLIGP